MGVIGKKENKEGERDAGYDEKVGEKRKFLNFPHKYHQIS